jgi:DDE_Tnp_1-associated/Transposase DDE domain
LSSAPAGSLLDYLQQIPDPRGRQGRRHALAAMLAAVVCGLLCGARGYAPIAQWLHAQPVDVWHLLGFLRRPPKKGAFRKLLMRIAPQAFEDAVRRWVDRVLAQLPKNSQIQAVAIDGKTLCGTLQPHQRTVHLLAAFDHQTGHVLSQTPVDDKTNEAKTALELIKGLILQSRLITGDAMFCQRDVCRAIIDSGGDYFLIVKDNQPPLRNDIAADFQPAFSPLHRAAAAETPRHCAS